MNNYINNYNIIAIGNIELRAIKNAQIDNFLKQYDDIVEQIWIQAQQNNNKKFFNGSILNFITFNQTQNKVEILGHFISYKQFLAQQIKSDLKLNIKPIGVSGIIFVIDNNNKYVLFSRRSNNTTEYQNLIELVPSGSIDQECVHNDGIIDYKSKLLAEFVEETNLSKEYIKEITGFSFVFDVVHNIYDVCCKIILNCSKKTILKNFNSNEYSQPILVSINDLDNFVTTNIKFIVPTSIAIIEAYKQHNNLLMQDNSNKTIK